ncbi:outer membrane protein assembly factor BamD [candidate division KSB1 bacterium]
MKVLLYYSIQALSLLLMFIMVTCSPNVTALRNAPPEEQFAFGKQLFEREDYLNAQIMFDRLARLNIISEYADSTQYYLAESYYLTNEFILAQSEYMRLIQRMPGSPLARDSMFKIGLCFYNMSPRPTLDQEYTESAMRAFVQYLSTFPDDTEYRDEVDRYILELRGKLAEKDFYNAEIYRKMGDYESAVIYYDVVLGEYYDTEVAARALYRKAQALLELERFSDAQEALQIFLRNFPEHELIFEVNEKMLEIKADISKIDTLNLQF